MFFNVYVWGSHGGWAMLSGLLHKCMYVFNFYWFCTLVYIPVHSLNEDFIIIFQLLRKCNFYYMFQLLDFDKSIIILCHVFHTVNPIS